MAMKQKEHKHMKKMLWALAALAGFLVLSCGWENEAAAEALTPENFSPLAKMGFTGWPDNERCYKLDALGVTVTACCTTPTEGHINNTINGNTGNYWHPNWTEGSLDKNGHKNDTRAYTGTGGYASISAYIAETDAAVSDVQNGIGGHWLTLDMGTEGVHDIASIAVICRGDEKNRKIRGYEIWYSDDPIGWDTNGATLAGKGTWPDEFAYQFCRFEHRISFRYIQIRQMYTSATSGYGCIANVYLETADGDVSELVLDTSLLYAAYTRGLRLLPGIDRSTTSYKTLQTALDAAYQLLNDETLKDMPAVNAQGTVDSQTNSLLAILDRLDPPRKPPEVF
jgi:hypothetical protein